MILRIFSIFASRAPESNSGSGLNSHTMRDIKVSELTVSQLNNIITEAIKEAMQDMLEDILALSSHEFKASIKEAREDYKKGRVKSFKEVFENEI